MPLPAVVSAVASFLRPATELSFAIQTITGSVKSLTVGLAKAALSLPAVPIKVFTAAIDLLNTPVLAVVGALKGFRDSVGAVGSAVSEFVKLASPVEVVKFNLALDDLTASIGKILIPVLTASTAFVRMFADVIFKLSDPFQKLMSAFFDPISELLPELLNAFSPLLSAFGEFVTMAAQVLTPVMKVLVPLLADAAIGFGAALAAISAPAIALAITGLVAAVGSLVVAFSPLIAAFAAIGYVIQQVFQYIGKALGIKSPVGGSVGAAVRPATIGSVEDYGKKAQQAAFSLGTAANPAEKTVTILDDIMKWLKDDFFNTLAEQFPKLAMAIAGVIPGGKEAVAVAKAVADPVAAGRRLADKAGAVADDVEDWIDRNKFW